MLRRRAFRTVTIPAIALALLFAAGALDASAPAHAEDATISWSVSVTPEDPHPGDTIEVTATVSGAQSPFMFQILNIDQDDADPVVDVVEHEEDYYAARITLHANHAGTATLSVNGFFEKTVCMEDPPPPMPPCFPHGYYESSPDVVIEVTGSPLCGDADIDGDADPIDAALILQFIAGLVEFFQIDHLDVDGSGDVDPIDVALVLQYTAGLVDAPAC